MEIFDFLIIVSVFLPFVAAAFVWIFKRKNYRASNYVLMIAAVEVVLTIVITLLQKNNDIVKINSIGGLGVTFTYSGFRGIYTILSAFAWFITFLFSKDYMKSDEKVIRYDFFNLFTLGATLGIFYAADFFTVFLFFEIMSLASFMWVLHNETKEAFYASGTYLAIAIAGGLAILMGIFIIWHNCGTLQFHELYEKAIIMEDKKAMYLAAGCMFIGFGAKAGAFPVHVWLPMSYTQAPAPATALLSAILSKTGIFGLLCIGSSILPMDEQWGMFILVIGVITMIVGGLCGLCCDNLKTTIAYSSMSQIGFILVGVGMQGLLMEENVLAVRGTILHMVNHTFVKLLLFMIAGVIFMQVGSYELNKVKGFGKKKPFLNVCFILGATGVGGIPLLNGYISKTLLHESIVEYQNLVNAGSLPFLQEITTDLRFYKAVEYLFLFSGGLTLAYMAKLYIVLFVEKNPDKKLQQQYEKNTDYIGIYSKISILVCALPIIAIGLFPSIFGETIMDRGMEFMHITEFGEKIAYFSLTNLTGAFISILVAFIMYFVVVRGLMLHTKYEGYHNPIPNWIDMENYIYRDVMFRLLPFLLCAIARILDSIVDGIVVALRKTIYKDRPLPYELPEGTNYTQFLGKFLKLIHDIRGRITHKKLEERNYEHEIALKREEMFEDMRIIERSLSFGLFMFCIGLTLTLMYLLIVN